MKRFTFISAIGSPSQLNSWIIGVIFLSFEMFFYHPQYGGLQKNHYMFVQPRMYKFSSIVFYFLWSRYYPICRQRKKIFGLGQKRKEL